VFDKLAERWLLQELSHLFTQSLALADIQLKIAVEILHFGVSVCSHVSYGLP
jgi:hypothetical protein